MNPIETDRKKNKLILLLAAISILCMQFFYQSHEYDGDLHHSSEICKICIKLSSLDNALSSQPSLLFYTKNVVIAYFFSDTSHKNPDSYRFIQPRAPPVNHS